MSDLISRADALEAIKSLPVELDAETVQRCIEAVSNLPSAQITSDVRHGRWVEEVTDDGKGFPRTEYTCPFCQYKTRADTNYCPECGKRLS